MGSLSMKIVFLDIISSVVNRPFMARTPALKNTVKGLSDRVGGGCFIPCFHCLSFFSFLGSHGFTEGTEALQIQGGKSPRTNRRGCLLQVGVQ